MTDQPILVIGATGKTGSRVVSKLEAKGVAVRRGRAASETPFDWENPATWAPVLSGVSKAYVTYFPDLAFPGAVEKLEAFTKVAAETGLQHIVLLSGRGEHFASMGEDIVRNSGLPFTIVRAAWFAQNFSEGYLRDPILGGVLPMPGGDMPEPIIDIDDIADVVVAALTEEGHIGERYEVTGPRLMTFAEMAEVLSTTLGRHISICRSRSRTSTRTSRLLAVTSWPMSSLRSRGKRWMAATPTRRTGSSAPWAASRATFAEFAQTAMAAGAWSAAA
jgi:uncharacterized protein YbjT (DUF2867 family)